MKNILINYIKTEFHGDNPDLDILPEDDLLIAGLVDSMGMMRLVQHIEEQFDIRVAPQDMVIENFISVEAMCNYIQQCKAT